MPRRVVMDQLKKPVETKFPEEKPKEAGAPRVLFRARSAWPLQLAPDELVIDENKITILHHIFLSSGTTRQIKLTDLANISLVSGPIFASITVHEKGFANDPSIVKRLWKEEAVRGRRLLEGISVMVSRGAKLEEMSVDEIVRQAEKAGAVVEVV